METNDIKQLVQARAEDLQQVSWFLSTWVTSQPASLQLVFLAQVNYGLKKKMVSTGSARFFLHLLSLARHPSQ